VPTGTVITIEALPGWPASFNGAIGTWTLTKQAGNDAYTLDGYVAPEETYVPVTDVLLKTGEQVVTEKIPEHARCTFDLNFGFGFITEILISFIKESVNDPNEFVGDIVSTPAKDGFMKFKLMVEDRIIYEKSHWEMLSEMVNVSNLDIQDVTKQSYGLKVFSADVDNTHIQDSVDLPPDLHDSNSLTLKHEAFMYRIPMTLFSGEEFQNGGLNISQLTNVKLIIEGTELLDEITPSDQRGLVPQVVLRRRNLNRVDGKTGSIHSTFN
jgi:hypothetical protein